MIAVVIFCCFSILEFIKSVFIVWAARSRMAAQGA